MQRSDIRAVGDLAGEASSVLTTLVRAMHAGVSGRVFDSIGPSANTDPGRSTTGLTRLIYSGVDRGDSWRRPCRGDRGRRSLG